VDCDLRKPNVHSLFRLPNQAGVTTLLRNDQVSLDSVAQETEVENLRVITSGPLPPNPAELLGSKRWHSILERMEAAVDMVVIDSPPLQAVTDAAVLSTQVDGTVFVIHGGHTRRGAVKQGSEALERGGGKVLGAVMNRLKESAFGEYYYRYYGYYSDEGEDKGSRGSGARGERAKGASVNESTGR
jgi:capsular exopolysaccharide synthesis family protein